MSRDEANRPSRGEPLQMPGRGASPEHKLPSLRRDAPTLPSPAELLALNAPVRRLSQTDEEPERHPYEPIAVAGPSRFSLPQQPLRPTFHDETRAPLFQGLPTWSHPSSQNSLQPPQHLLKPVSPSSNPNPDSWRLSPLPDMSRPEPPLPSGGPMRPPPSQQHQQRQHQQQHSSSGPAEYDQAGGEVGSSNAMASQEDGPICSNCSTRTTPLWRRDGRGGLLCNACGLFAKVKGRPRPHSLKTDVIKPRARKNRRQNLIALTTDGSAPYYLGPPSLSLDYSASSSSAPPQHGPPHEGYMSSGKNSPETDRGYPLHDGRGGPMPDPRHHAQRWPSSAPAHLSDSESHPAYGIPPEGDGRVGAPRGWYNERSYGGERHLHAPPMASASMPDTRMMYRADESPPRNEPSPPSGRGLPPLLPRGEPSRYPSHPSVSPLAPQEAFHSRPISPTRDAGPPPPLPPHRGPSHHYVEHPGGPSDYYRSPRALAPPFSSQHHGQHGEDRRQLPPIVSPTGPRHDDERDASMRWRPERSPHMHAETAGFDSRHDEWPPASHSHQRRSR